MSTGEDQIREEPYLLGSDYGLSEPLLQVDPDPHPGLPAGSKDPITTVVLKMQWGCIDKICKIVCEIEGVYELKFDNQKELATVKGTMDVKALVEALKKKLKKNVEIVLQVEPDPRLPAGSKTKASRKGKFFSQIQFQQDIDKHENISPAGSKIQFQQDIEKHENISPPCIFRTPFPDFESQQPRLVTIGPYRLGTNLPLDKHKYFFRDKFLHRNENRGRDLCFYVKEMMELEWNTRRCYSEDFSMYSSEFVEMLLLDGCFVMEVLAHFGSDNEYDDDDDDDESFPIEPSQIPILVQDLILLENQIPLFVLEKLYGSLQIEEGEASVCISTMAMKFFNLAFPLCTDDLSYNFNHKKPKHLLDLFLQFIRPTPHLKTITIPKYTYMSKEHTKNSLDVVPKSFRPSNRQSSMKGIWDFLIENQDFESHPNPKRDMSSKRFELEQQFDPLHWTCLRESIMELPEKFSIEFKPSKAERFTDIRFKDGVLEIPPVTINKLFMTILINCVAFEHAYNRRPKDLTAYVHFMCSVIKRPSDAKFLCSKEVISIYSDDHENIAKSFQFLWRNTSDLPIEEDFYISRTVLEIESYSKKDRITSWPGQYYFVRYRKVFLICIISFLFAAKSLIMNQMIQFVKQGKLQAVYANMIKFQGDICGLFEGHGSSICKGVFFIIRDVYENMTNFQGDVCGLFQGHRSSIYKCVLFIIRAIFKNRKPSLSSPDLGIRKFLVFCFLNLITIMILKVSFQGSSFDHSPNTNEAESPALSDDGQDTPSVSDIGPSKLTDDKQETEVEHSRPKPVEEDTTELSWSYQTTKDERWSKVDFKSIDVEDYDEYYNEWWTRIEGEKGIKCFFHS